MLRIAESLETRGDGTKKPHLVDIVCGICTKNCADTIKNVVEQVDAGLTEFFPSKQCLIVVSDGFSTDGTKNKAQNVDANTELVVTSQTGGPGKGNGVRTILEIAKNRRAEAVGLVDGDLTSIEPDWIAKLVGPIMEGEDLVVPYYIRHRYDGVLTNQIVYPLTNVLFGIGVRQPIGGEYGLSVHLVDCLLQHELFPEDFGIDIFITLVGESERMQIVEAVLGIKEHESTKQYADPETLLVPMFYQVVGTLFRLISYYQDRIKTVRGIKPVERLGKMPTQRPGEIAVDQNNLLSRFHAKYNDLEWESLAFLGSLRKQLDHVASCSPEQFRFPLELWVKAVYLAIGAFAKSEDPAVLDALRVLWQGRFLGLVRETKAMSDEEVESYIQGQLATFKQHKPMLNG